MRVRTVVASGVGVVGVVAVVTLLVVMGREPDRLDSPKVVDGGGSGSTNVGTSTTSNVFYRGAGEVITIPPGSTVIEPSSAPPVRRIHALAAADQPASLALSSGRILAGAQTITSVPPRNSPLWVYPPAGITVVWPQDAATGAQPCYHYFNFPVRPHVTYITVETEYTTRAVNTHLVEPDGSWTMWAPTRCPVSEEDVASHSHVATVTYYPSRKISQHRFTTIEEQVIVKEKR